MSRATTTQPHGVRITAYEVAYDIETGAGRRPAWDALATVWPDVDSSVVDVLAIEDQINDELREDGGTGYLRWRDDTEGRDDAEGRALVLVFVGRVVVLHRVST